MPRLPMAVTIDANSGIPIIAIAGDVDMDTAPDLDDCLLGLISPHVPVVIVDLTKTPFIDSSGLAVLVHARNRGKQTGTEIRVVAVEQRIFEVTGLATVFAIFKVLDEALVVL